MAGESRNNHRTVSGRSRPDDRRLFHDYNFQLIQGALPPRLFARGTWGSESTGGTRWMLSIGLLGALTIRVDDRRIKADFGSAGRLLVAYLAHYSGRPHRRERLADLFWGGLEPNRGALCPEHGAVAPAQGDCRGTTERRRAQSRHARQRDRARTGGLVRHRYAALRCLGEERSARLGRRCPRVIGKLADGGAAAIFGTLPRGRGRGLGPGRARAAAFTLRSRRPQACPALCQA